MQKGGAALKYGGGGGARQGANRNVKVTIGNKLRWVLTKWCGVGWNRFNPSDVQASPICSTS